MSKVQRLRIAVYVLTEGEIMDPKMLPTSKTEIAELLLDWDRLDVDTSAECPVSMSEIVRYISAETGGERPPLIFGRTARIDSVSFWVWGFVSSFGETFYVDVSSDGRESLVGMGSGESFTVPQYVALRYVRFWRK